MEDPHPAALTPAGAAGAPALLVSLHDVSPLTLAECERAVALLGEVGLGPASLTVLAIPCHEGRAPLDAHPPTVRFLRALADGGARLVMHGLTHSMPGRAWSPAGFFRGHLFARGQGELLRAGAEDVGRRLAEGREILERAGLAEAARAFVPPAWLLSPAARQVVRAAGFDFYETFAGIVQADRVRAPRVIGWGSLNGVEAVGTALWAWAQSHLAPADTRLCVHPADMRRPRQCRAIRGVLGRLLPRMRAQSYTTYLAS
jgi:predicted deacetylase